MTFRTLRAKVLSAWKSQMDTREWRHANSRSFIRLASTLSLYTEKASFPSSIASAPSTPLSRGRGYRAGRLPGVINEHLNTRNCVGSKNKTRVESKEQEVAAATGSSQMYRRCYPTICWITFPRVLLGEMQVWK